MRTSESICRSIRLAKVGGICSIIPVKLYSTPLVRIPIGPCLAIAKRISSTALNFIMSAVKRRACNVRASKLAYLCSPALAPVIISGTIRAASACNSAMSASGRSKARALIKVALICRSLTSGNVISRLSCVKGVPADITSSHEAVPVTCAGISTQKALF